MEQEKVTIKVAARALGVHEKTILRYLAKGRLTRVREGGHTYLLLSEVVALRDGTQVQEQEQGQGNNVSTPESTDMHRTGGASTVTIDLERYEGLLVRLGQLQERNQILEGENRKLVGLLEDMRTGSATSPPGQSKNKRPWFGRLVDWLQH